MRSTSSERRTWHPGPEAARGVLGSPARAFVLIFLLSVAVRAAVLAVWAGSHENFQRLGGETGRVALSLLRSGEFADPYMIPTGSTAHPTPLWPALLALIYGAFGTTATAGYVRAMVAVGSYSALFALLPWFARSLRLGTAAGTLAGVAGALIPRQGLDEIIGYGVSAHAALAFGLVTVAFLRRWNVEQPSAAGSVLLGTACGAAFHLLPPLLLVVCGYLLFELCWKRDRRKWVLSAWVAAGAVLACVPWTWRNYTALHGFFFIRSNFGLELRIANHTGAGADIDVTLARQGTLRHPSENLEEARRVRDLGEAEYNRRARNEALEWIKAHPTGFLRLTLMRFLYFWCGPLHDPWPAALTTSVTALAALGLRRALRVLDAPGRAALLIPLVAFPLVYYAVSYVGHYPAPLAWLLLLLGGYEVRSRMGRGGPPCASPAEPDNAAPGSGGGFPAGPAGT